MYVDHVEGGRAEGLVVRAANTRTYKVKPSIQIDAVVVGYTARAESPDLARNLLLALMRPDGTFQLVGSLGNMGDEAQRREILAQLVPLQAESAVKKASSDGALYRFVRPELIVQFRVNDVQSTSSDGSDVRRMVLDYGPSGWAARRKMPGVILFHPVFESFRPDKAVNPVDLRMEQVLDRCFVDEVDKSASVDALPPSHRLARQVYTKTTKGVMAVRKLVAWKTNKQDVDPRYPAYVVHFTDYSPGRQEPLQRTVRTAPTQEAARIAFEELLEEKKVMTGGVLTRGWSEVESSRLSFDV
jgi:hypothetical protein